MVVNTHLHFDHCGGNRLFAGLPIHVQARELEDARTQDDYTIREWVDFPGATYAEHDGEVEILPGRQARAGARPHRRAPDRRRRDRRGERSSSAATSATRSGRSARGTRPGSGSCSSSPRRRTSRTPASRTFRARTGSATYSSGIRAVTAASTLSWIEGTSCISARKPDAVRTRIRAGPRVFTVAVRGSARDEGDLADEVAGAELVHDLALADDVGLALDEDDELEAARALAREVARLREVELVRERGDQAELTLRAALEQRNPLQQLDLRVLSQHRPGTVSCMTAVRRNDRRCGSQSDREEERHAVAHSRRRARGSGRERARRAERRRPRRDRGRAVGLRDAGRRAGVEHRPQRRAHRRLARFRCGDDGRPTVRLLDADELQRRRGRAGRASSISWSRAASR